MKVKWKWRGQDEGKRCESEGEDNKSENEVPKAEVIFSPMSPVIFRGQSNQNM